MSAAEFGEMRKEKTISKTRKGENKGDLEKPIWGFVHIIDGELGFGVVLKDVLCLEKTGEREQSLDLKTPIWGFYQIIAKKKGFGWF